MKEDLVGENLKGCFSLCLVLSQLSQTLRVCLDASTTVLKLLREVASS